MNHVQQAINELIKRTEESVIGQSHGSSLGYQFAHQWTCVIEGLPGTAKTRSVKSLAQS